MASGLQALALAPDASDLAAESVPFDARASESGVAERLRDGGPRADPHRPASRKPEQRPLG